MNSKLVILAEGKAMALNEDFSISIDLQNPIFNDVDMFSYPVSVPIFGNRHILKNIDDVNSDIRPISYEHTPMQILVDGIPFASGTAVIQEDSTIEDNFSFNIEAGTQSFNDLIGDLQCQDIPIPNEDRVSLKIGEKIGNVHVKLKYKYHAKVKYKGKKSDDDIYSDKADLVESVIEPQALGFSFPGICVTDDRQFCSEIQMTKEYNDGTVIVPLVRTSFINVSDEYDANSRYTNAPPAKFCNARVCYKHYGIGDDGGTSSDVVQAKDSTNLYEDKSPYWVLDANRPQSGICFYVLYFLDCLFRYLNVQFDKSALLKVEDFKHLCFFTTHCKYDTEIAYGSKDKPFYNDIDSINKWLSSRGCGGQFELENTSSKEVQSFVIDGEPKVVGQDNITSIQLESTVTFSTISANIMSMYANSENFPKDSVSNVISSLENAFGIKFNYDYEQKKVTAYLIRDIFRKQNPVPRIFRANVLSSVQVSEKITGVRQRYSSEVDSKEQKQYVKDYYKNINTGYDTDYNYIDYPKERTIYREHLYKDIYSSISSGDKNVYIDTTTGNAYRVKVDSDASTHDALRPVLFEVGQWKGVDYGDCSTINEDFVRSFDIDFTPITFSDVNYNRELLLASGSITGSYNGKTYSITDINKKDLQPILAAYIEEDMEHEFIEQRIRNAVSSSWADFYLTEVLKLIESYDPSKTEDGNSPLQSYDWGLSIAMMRGGGADLTMQSFDNDYDGFGNSKWCTVSGQYAITSDTMDCWGNEYDYNGVNPGVGEGDRFSLKIRAYKQPQWATSPLCSAEVMNRGLFDTFMIDYAYFLLNRKKYVIKCLTSVAQIVDIQNHWKEWWLIDGKKCLINKISADISAKNGLGEIEMEVYSL